MTKIKLCGLTRPCDIDVANELMPEYIGFVFAKKSRRAVTREQAALLKKQLAEGIKAVGVFVNEDVQRIAELLNTGLIDAAQLHGSESEEDIRALRKLTDMPIIKAFSVRGPRDIALAEASAADYVLLDSGTGGTGTTFDWGLIRNMRKPFFLAGGLDCSNVAAAVSGLSPYAVDVSSGIETDGVKDAAKMRDFVIAVRGKEERP